ncbi:hypothetical protein ACWGOQ_0023695 [Aquimarina sp. M1]
MKRILKFVLVVVTMAIVTSCNKDDESVSPNTVMVNETFYTLNGGLLDRKIEWQGDKYFRVFDMVLYGGGIERTGSSFRGKGVIVVARMYVTGLENYMDDGHYVFGVTPKPLTFSRVGYSTNFDVNSSENDALIPLDSGSMDVVWDNQHKISFDIRNNNGDVIRGLFDDDMIIH